MARLDRISVILYALPLLAAVHIAVYYSSLPDRVASHFGPTGAADGWMSKSAFAAFYVILITGSTLLIAGVGTLMRVLPPDLINVPYKDYWLAPERRAETAQTFAQQMSSFGILTDLLLIAVHHLCIQANFRQPPHLNNGAAFTLLGAYLVCTLLWTIQLYRPFRKPA